MAIVSRYVNYDFQKLAEVWQEFNFNGTTATYFSASNAVEISDKDENILARFDHNPYSSNFSLTAYYDYTAQDQSTSVIYALGNGGSMKNVWKCKNGIIIESVTNSGRYIPIYVVKTNTGKTAFVFSTSSSADSNLYHTDLTAVTYGDAKNASFSDFSFTPTLRRCSVITPIVTMSDYGVAQYTYKSGYMPFNTSYDGQSASPKEMIMNNVHYLTDTYFAIEDEGDVPPNTSST